MSQIVYYVATSVDGFIANREGDISGFTYDDAFTSYYYEQLKTFQTVIMGKDTYEFGYKFGLKPGQRAYPHMDHQFFQKQFICR